MTIDGNGRVMGPAPAVQSSPEQERLAAEKLAKAREHRAARKATQQAAAQTEAPGSPQTSDTAPTDATGPAAESPADSETPELQPAEPDADQAAAQAAEAKERADLMARADALGLHDRYSFDAGTSLKILRRKIEDAAAETQAAERHEAAPAAVPDDAEYQAARETWQEAEARHHALQAEYAGLPGRIEDAIASGDYPQVQELRQRRTVLPFAIQTAELDACKVKLGYYQLRVPRARAVKQEARMASAEVNEAFEAWKARTYEAASAAVEAAQASDDAVRDLGTIQRELDRLMAELAG